MFSSQHDVLRTDFFKELSPLFRIPLLCFELGDNVLVSKLRRLRAKSLFHQGVVVFRVTVQQLRHMFGVAFVAFLVADHAVRSPMDEDSDLAVIKPCRHRHLLQRFPGPVVWFALSLRVETWRNQESRK